MTRRNRHHDDPYGTHPSFQSPNPSRLYRSTNDKFLYGVIGGIADRFGWDSSILRIITVVTAFASGIFPVLVGYLIAAMVMPTRPFGSYSQMDNPEDTAFWREVSDRPRATFRGVKYKFMDLEERLRNLETSVTSDEWRLRREFRDLENK